MKTFEQLAHDLAVNAKAMGGEIDFGCLWDRGDHGHLSDTEWQALWMRAEELLPTVRVPRKVQELHNEAAREYRAECRSELRHFA